MYYILLLLAAVLPDGSIVVWDGGLLVRPIRNSTGSNYTHVAIAIDNNIYEATPPVVRKLPVDEYFKRLAYIGKQPFWQKRDFSYFTMLPKEPFTEKQVNAMRVYAESQIGRTYMLRGYWQNREVRGIMCSQYVGNILERSGLIKSSNYKESPISLYNKIKPYYERY
jgi:hypothetical protein